MLSMRILTRNVRQCVLMKSYSSRTVVPTSINVVNEKDATDRDDPINVGDKNLANKIFKKIKFLHKDDINVAGTDTQASKPIDLLKTEPPPRKAKSKAENSIKDVEALIKNATSVSELLSVSTVENLKPEHARKVISTLTEWTQTNRVEASEFENNAQYLNLCMLTLPKRATKPTTLSPSILPGRSSDLDMILNIAADNEAEKIIVALQLPQMVRVLSALAKKQRRSTPLLRSIAYNISSHKKILNLKECSDVLYAMTKLSFYDIILLTRVSTDTQLLLKQNKQAAPVGSIITSLGHLRYRDTDLLDNLANWILQHENLYRAKDLASLFITLGILNYPTIHVEQLKSKLLPIINQQEIKSSLWLDLVWALSVLKIVETKHLESVLNENFIERLVEERGEHLTPIIKMKLLNINSYAKYIHPNYTGSNLLANGTVYSIPFVYSKNKQTLIDGLLPALKSLFTNASYTRTMHDTKMGFVIDAECCLDKNRLPLQINEEHKNAFRIAFMVLDFNEICQGNTQNEISGWSALSHTLLEKKGYTVIHVPYDEFNTSDKLLKRVEYLDAKLRQVVGDKN